jgi:8-oxo-dGTP pyrophosphatase MutT (NUDIX family)
VSGARERRVVTAFLVSGGEVLVLRRSPAVRTYPGRWAGVSGSVEPGRAPLEQLELELREETGLAPEDYEVVREGAVLDVLAPELGLTWRVTPFLVALAAGRTLRLDWEHTEARWVRPADLPALETVPSLLEAFERVAR